MEKIKAIFCVLFGHSNIVTCFLGYVSCGRCGVQLGDNLGGSYGNSKAAYARCGCEKCHENFAKMGWRDKLWVPEETIENVLKTKEQVKQEHDEAMQAMRDWNKERREALGL